MIYLLGKLYFGLGLGIRQWGMEMGGEGGRGKEERVTDLCLESGCATQAIRTGP